MEQQHYTTEPQIAPVTGDERTLAILAHILTLVGGFLVPLIIWLVKKDESVFVAESAKESLNFQITLFIAFAICFLLIFVLIGAFLMPIVGLIGLVLVIVATIRTSEGKIYRYPLSIRLIK
jgi:uncharacterized protein